MEIDNGLIIIDSGFDTTNKELYKSVIGGVCINNGVVIDEFEDLNGHGTACTYTAKRYNNNIRVFMIKVLDKDAKCSVENLIKALHYSKKVNIRTICLSLSTPISEPGLWDICEELMKNGKILVAALNNSDRISFPAMYEGVIGVRNTHLSDENDFWFDEGKLIQCVVDGTPILAPYIGDDMWFFGGNSKATPIIAARISGYLSKNNLLTLKEIVNCLRRDAVKVGFNIEDIDKHIKLENYIFDRNDKDQLEIKELIEKVTRRVIDINLLESYRLYELGLNKYNIWSLIKELENTFTVDLDYKSISLRNFISIQSIKELIVRYSGGNND